MESDQPEITLGNLVTLRRGTTYKGVLVGLPGPVLLGLSSIQRDGGFRQDSFKTYGGESPDNITLGPGDLYVSLKDVTQSGDLLGAACRVPMDVDIGRLTQDTVRLLPITGECDLNYLYWVLRTPEYRQYCRSHAIGTTNLSISRTDFLNFPVPGETPIRRTLVNLLDLLEDKIELNRRMNETLEGIARALFKSWFVDFDPVRAKAEGRQPVGMDSETAALFPDSFQESELGLIPREWEYKTVGAVTEVLETGARPRGGVRNVLDGVPSIGAEHIEGLGIFDFAKTKYVPIEYHQQMRRGHVLDRDVLIYKDGGKPGLFEPHVAMFGNGFPFQTMCINEHVFRFRAAHPLSQDFAFFWLSSPLLLDQMRMRATGVAQPGLNQAAVKAMPALVPTGAIISVFDALVRPLVSRILSNALESLTLAQIRDALLPKLISGELRVPDAERFLSKSPS